MNQDDFNQKISALLTGINQKMPVNIMLERSVDAIMTLLACDDISMSDKVNSYNILAQIAHSYALLVSVDMARHVPTGCCGRICNFKTVKRVVINKLLGGCEPLFFCLFAMDRQGIMKIGK